MFVRVRIETLDADGAGRTAPATARPDGAAWGKGDPAPEGWAAYCPPCDNRGAALDQLVRLGRGLQRQQAVNVGPQAPHGARHTWSPGCLRGSRPS